MARVRTGTIHKLPSGKWLARYTAPGGKRFGRTFLTKTDGNAWLHRQYAAISEGSWEKSTALTPILFRDYAANWLAHRTVQGRPIADRTREGWKGFSPFAHAHSADALVSVHVSDGQDQSDDHNTAAHALRQAMSAASGVHNEYIGQAEEDFHMMTLPVLVTGGELYGASLGSNGDVHVDDLSHVFVKTPRPGGSSVGGVHVMTFNYFAGSFVPGLASVQSELIP